MNATTNRKPDVGYIHLTLHLVNGKQRPFVQPESQAAQNLLNHLRPERIFAQKQFLISGKDSVTIIPSENVERVDFRSDPLPGWAHSETIHSVHEVSAEEFLQIQRREPPAAPLVLGRPMPPPPAQFGLLVELRSGLMTYLSIRPKLPIAGGPPVVKPTPEDTRLFLQHLFTRPILFGNMIDDQGIFLLNPANAVRFTLTPPPPEPSAGSWMLETPLS